MAIWDRPVTEAEWAECRHPGRLLEFVRETPDATLNALAIDHPLGRRRLRLFGIATFRPLLSLFDDPRIVASFLAGEAFAEGLGTEEHFDQIGKAIGTIHLAPVAEDGSPEYFRQRLTVYNRERFALMAACCMVSSHAGATAEAYKRAALALAGENAADEYARQCDLFRDIFGNPFRATVLDRRWRTEDTIGLSLGIYEDCAFDRMPLLADALMDAGCDNEEIIAHCRSDRAHVRGCWVLDLILGKS
jgi:hypothetical protein